MSQLEPLAAPPRAQVWLLWSQETLTVQYLEALGRTGKSLVCRRAGLISTVSVGPLELSHPRGL